MLHRRTGHACACVALLGAAATLLDDVATWPSSARWPRSSIPAATACRNIRCTDDNTQRACLAALAGRLWPLEKVLVSCISTHLRTHCMQHAHDIKLPLVSKGEVYQ